MKLLFAAALIAFSTSSFSIDTVLQGKIQGSPWTFVSGRAKPSFFRPGFFEFDFWDHMESKPCDSFTWGSERKILSGMPAKTGKFTMGNTQNLTFNFPENQNYISTSGTFIITKITENTVEGSINTKYDAKNFVAGSFVVELCK